MHGRVSVCFYFLAHLQPRYEVIYERKIYIPKVLNFLFFVFITEKRFRHSNPVSFICLCPLIIIAVTVCLQKKETNNNNIGCNLERKKKQTDEHAFAFYTLARFYR